MIQINILKKIFSIVIFPFYIVFALIGGLLTATIMSYANSGSMVVRMARKEEKERKKREKELKKQEKKKRT